MSKKSSKVSNKNKQEILFQPNFPKNEFSDWNFENLTPDLELAPPRYQVCQCSGKTVNFDFFGPNLTKNGFWGQNFNFKSGFGISTSKIPCVPIFWQNGQIWIFRPKFGEIAQLHAIFGSYNVDSVAVSWIEAEMSWMVMNGAGWRWVHPLAIPIFRTSILLFMKPGNISKVLWKKSKTKKKDTLKSTTNNCTMTETHFRV